MAIDLEQHKRMNKKCIFKTKTKHTHTNCSTECVWKEENENCIAADITIINFSVFLFVRSNDFFFSFESLLKLSVMFFFGIRKKSKKSIFI